jgi:L-iditol 2-dehydrogenase
LKALVLEEYNHFVYKDVPEPVLGTNDVMVRVAACGICGSDVHGMDGSTGRRIPPLIMGHEASGVIVGVGSKVTKIQPGERVTFDSTVYCGTCFYCRRGDINLCDHRRVLGVSCDEYHQNGAFADCVAVPQHVIYPLPEKIGFAQSAMVEPCSVALHAVERTSVSIGDTAVVEGTGIIGLLVVQILRAGGWRQIIAVDLDVFQEEIESMGRKALPLQLDVRDYDSIQRMVEDAWDHYGQIEILVNNAGCNVRKPSVDVTWDDWNLVLDTNLRGTFAYVTGQTMLVDGGITTGSTRALPAQKP